MKYKFEKPLTFSRHLGRVCRAQGARLEGWALIGTEVVDLRPERYGYAPIDVLGFFLGF